MNDQTKPAYKRKKLITVPQLKFAKEKRYYLKFTAPMFRSTFNKAPVEGEKKKEPPFIMSVFNLEDEQEYEIIVPTVLKKLLEENYPNDEYVGKNFEIEQYHKSDTGKEYNTFFIAELE